MRSIPDAATRLSALKGGEVDIIYWVSGVLAQELLRNPALKLDVSHTATWWIYFLEQFDPKSPWHDIRVRQATALAIDLKNINQAITLGYSKVTGNAFVPSHFEYFWQPPEPVYDPAKAKQLLADAGYPNGLDAGPFYVDAAFSNTVEAIANSLREIGIRSNVRPLERAAFYKGYSEKKLKGLIMGGSAAFGNAATRLEAFVVKGGTYAYGSYPEIDELFEKQAVELDHEKRAALLDRILQLVLEKMIAAPVWHLAALSGVGPRVGQSGIGLIGGDPWSSPYEDVTLKGA